MNTRSLSVLLAAVLGLLLVWNVYHMEFDTRPAGTTTDPSVTLVQTPTQPAWPKPVPKP